MLAIWLTQYIKIIFKEAIPFISFKKKLPGEDNSFFHKHMGQLQTWKQSQKELSVDLHSDSPAQVQIEAAGLKTLTAHHWFVTRWRLLQLGQGFNIIQVSPLLTLC